MEKDSALYQLMDTRMNGVMNGIVSRTPPSPKSLDFKPFFDTFA